MVFILDDSQKAGVLRKKLNMSVKRRQSKTSPTIDESKKEKSQQLSSKEFDVFGVTITSEFVRLCSLYITRHPDCAPTDDEKKWTRVNMIARNKGESIANMEDDGHFLSDCLEMVVLQPSDNSRVHGKTSKDYREVMGDISVITISKHPINPKWKKKKI